MLSNPKAEATMSCQHTEGPNHDCDYITRRNRLIAAAERHAFRIAGEEPEAAKNSVVYTRWATAWNRAFFDEMTERWNAEEAKEKKLRGQVESELGDLVKRWRARGATARTIDAVVRGTSAAA